jgi:hypothetical protein
LIFRGSELSGHFLLEKLRKDFASAHPLRETLFYTGKELSDFIKKSPETVLRNFYSLHLRLLAVIVENLQTNELSAAEQDKLALFLKSLTAHHVQIIVSTQLVFEQYGSNSECITRELWSWFMSGREYSLPYGCVTYTKDLSGALTLTQDKKRNTWVSKLIRSHAFGMLYPGILSNEFGRTFSENMKMELGILWLGTFYPPSRLFPRAKCPVCQQEKLLPYSCIASALSGGHVLRFYCQHCAERIATNDAPDYFRLLRNFSLQHPVFRARKDRCFYHT